MTANTKAALITGASSGIGADLAKVIAKDGYNLILVARNRESLKTVADEISSSTGVNVEIIAKDLSLSKTIEELYQEVREKNFNVEVLVNNAGFGLFGEFTETAWEKEQQMIQLNIAALTHLTKLFLPDMLRNKKGKILNVASTAAFQPGPYMAVYYASKAYVLHFSEAIAKELEGTGVTVTTLCPGPTKSGFQKAASMEKSKLLRLKFATSAEVARDGYKAMMRGRPVVISGFMNNIMATSVRFLPRKIVTSISKAISAPQN